MCPYYMAKAKLGTFDIVVLPYHYILKFKTLIKLQLDLKNCVLVFDEAHNIAYNCESLYSFHILLPLKFGELSSTSDYDSKKLMD